MGAPCWRGAPTDQQAPATGRTSGSHSDRMPG
jgi:hypothetical protein